MALTVRNAAAATSVAQEYIDRAVKLLGKHAKVNALGVLMRPADRRAALEEASKELLIAATLIKGTTWPTERDYASE